ncbi:MAG TPA: hypothetical protein VFZ34_05320 [Blastocatellia bacterium]|nr:hypothetical protein [Blastocatellia bacterium]
MKIKLPARALAAQLLNAQQRFASFSNEQRLLALDMLTTHIEATRKLGTPGSYKAATTDAIFMASIHETAYEPIPTAPHSISSSLNNLHGAIWAEDL